ncbi:hypothetical protein KJ953_01280 [Patescibacteria group bacterium]|nr:hypothetical protein [Patescibacteria group bacterium]
MAGRGFYRRKRKKSLSRLYLLIVLILGFVVFKWGFSALIEIIAKTGGGDQKVMELGDVVAPQTPVISGLPEATNSAQIKIEGYTEAGVEVEYFINNRRVITEQTNEDGFYQTVLSLDEGENEIKIIAKDEAENESISKPVKVIYDFKAPKILLSSPTNGQEFFGQQEQVITVSGEVSESEADLRINNTYVRLDGNGSFSLRVSLNEGENEIKLVATDKAGNLTEETIKVSYVR